MEHLSRIFAKAGLTVDNGATFNGLVNANTDTDRFLVADNGVLKFRTGAEILSDIGGASSASGLPIGGTAGQILAKIDATNYNTEWIDNFTTDVRQYVKAGEAINKGQAVYISSADGTNPIVSKASNASEATSSKTLGLLAQNLSHNGFGYVITEGRLSGLDTSSAQIADPVWLGTNGNLIFGLANKPIAPAHLVYLGVVTRVNQNNGEIFVHVQNGVELNEIHDVLIQSVANKDILYRDASTNLWKNASIATVLGFTPADNAALANYQLTSQKAQPNGYASLDGNGKVPLAQMNDSIIGQVEYMGLWNAATNTPTLSSTPQQKGHYYIVSAAGTQFGITFEIGDWIISDGTTWSKVDNTDAVSSVFGRVGNVAAAEADYQSFYPRLSQVYANPSWISELAWSKITGTPTTLAGYGITDAVPSSRTITINGTTYDLSANRTWTISEADTLATVTARGNTTSANVFLGQYLRTGSYPHFGETVGGLATLVGNNVLPGTGVNKIVRYAGGDNGTYIILRYNAGIIFGTALASTVGSEVDDTSAEAMRITTNRNVLINTSVDTGDYRLDANGFFRLGPSAGHNISIGPNYQFRSLVSNTIITQDSENISLYANNTGNIVLGTQAVPRFAVNNNGTITASSLSGTGTRMVVADSSGILSTQTIPSLSGYVQGSGTINYLSKFTASGTIGNSQLFDNGTNVEIGYGSAQGLYKLDVNGSVRVNTNLYVVDAIGIGVAPNTNRPLQILKNLNTTVGIRFENTNTGANAFSALQMGEDINATGTKFVNFLYVNSSVSRYGAYVPQGTSLINVGSGGLNLGTVGGGISFYNALLSKAGEMFSSGNWYLGTGLTPTDAGFRLDVSGTLRTTGAVTFSSLAGTGTRMVVTDSSGVLSTQAIPSLSGYVPYSGATTNVDLNTQTLSAGLVYVEGQGGNGGQIGFKQYVGSSLVGLSGYNTISSITKNTFVFSLHQSGTDYKRIQLQFTNVPLSSVGVPSLELPSQSGTLALISDISTAINGTTNWIPRFTSANTIGLSNLYDGSSFIGVFTATDNLSGAKLQVNGAATFSGSVTAGGITSTGTNTMLSASTSTAGLIVRGGSSVGAASSSSGQILIGQTSTYRGSVAYDDNTGYMYIDNLYDNANSNIYFRVRTNGTPINALTLFGSGAATFSGNVSIGTTSTFSNPLTISIGAGGAGSTNNQLAMTHSGASTAYYLKTIRAAANDEPVGLAFVKNATEQMRLDTSGNLGLGVTPSNAGTGYSLLQGGGYSIYSGNVQTANFSANEFSDSNGNPIYRNTGSPAGKYSINGNVHSWSIAPSGTAGNAISFTQAMTLDASGNLLIGQLSAAGKLTIGQTAGNSAIAFVDTTNSKTNFINVNNGQFQFWVHGPTQAMTLDASGRLGIGTPTPETLLHVSSNNSGTQGGIISVANSAATATSNASSIGFKSSSAFTSGYYSARISSVMNSATVTDNHLAFYLYDGANIAATEKMRITSSGNVGIGTASPETLLHINKNTAGGEGGYIYLDNGAASTLSSSVGIRFGTSSGASFAGVYTGEIKNIITNAGDGASALTFGTFDGSSAAERMRISASGNVGIGVTPSAWGSNAKALQFSGGSLWNFTSSYLFLSQNAYFDNSNQIYINSAAASDYYQFNGQHIWRTAPSGTAGNAITFTQAMTLDASSNLSIANEMYLDNGKYLRFKRNSGGLSIQTLGIESGTDDVRLLTTGAFNIVNGSLTKMLSITSSGNVGIGTASPVSLLNLYSSLPILRWQNPTSGSGASDGADIYLDGSDFWMRNIELGILGFATYGSERMRINSAGRVLIGTTTDNTVDLLQVAGSGYFADTLNLYSASGVQLRLNNSTTGTTSNDGTRIYLSGSDLFIVNRENANIQLYTNDTERMRITSGGYLKASNIGTYVGSTSSWHELRTNNAGEPIAIVSASSGSYGGVGLQVRVNRTSTGGNYLFLQAWDEAAAVARFRVLDSGNVENTNGSYGTISDISLKENIVDATPKLLDILNLKVKNFNLKADENKLKQIGFIAQEFEEVFPSMIDTDQKTGLKSIKTSVLIPVLVKAIQELKTELDTLKK